MWGEENDEKWEKEGTVDKLFYFDFLFFDLTHVVPTEDEDEAKHTKDPMEGISYFFLKFINSLLVFFKGCGILV